MFYTRCLFIYLFIFISPQYLQDPSADHRDTLPHDGDWLKL